VKKDYDALIIVFNIRHVFQMNRGKALEVLQKIYGYGAFRGQQAEIIDHVISGKNAFVLMPTGGGKSLCYQIPSLCRQGVGIVVSPVDCIDAESGRCVMPAGPARRSG
jgi:ATP-dependent DNA helicase RecQ